MSPLATSSVFFLHCYLVRGGRTLVAQPLPSRSPIAHRPRACHAHKLSTRTGSAHRLARPRARSSTSPDARTSLGASWASASAHASSLDSPRPPPGRSSSAPRVADRPRNGLIRRRRPRLQRAEVHALEFDVPARAARSASRRSFASTVARGLMLSRRSCGACIGLDSLRSSGTEEGAQFAPFAFCAPLTRRV